MPDEVTSFIAKVIPSNIRELEGALIRVVAYASLTKSPITAELAAEVLKSPVAKHRCAGLRSLRSRNGRQGPRPHGQRDGPRAARSAPRCSATDRHVSRDRADRLLLAANRARVRKKDHTTVMYARDKIKDHMHGTKHTATRFVTPRDLPEAVNIYAHQVGALRHGLRAARRIGGPWKRCMMCRSYQSTAYPSRKRRADAV